mmetsp:Transcript_9076/g.12332  ORF Transcript_9076/g.12332 Transcript_9076/m.12332 type:complete len:257 (+) Transcript_9076:131-901(+)
MSYITDFNCEIEDNRLSDIDENETKPDELHMIINTRILRRLRASQGPVQRKGIQIVRETLSANAEKRMGRQEMLDIVAENLNANHIKAIHRQAKSTLAHDFISPQNSYVEVFQGSANHSESLIVEIFFREQFEIVRPTQSYFRILSEIPISFFGTKFELTAIVEFMAEKMAESFHRQGMSMPPWRKAYNLLAKWDLNRDVIISAVHVHQTNATTRNEEPVLSNEINEGLLIEFKDSDPHRYSQNGFIPIVASSVAT